jgi:hypothetical protein
LTYEERSCCVVGGNEASPDCPEKDFNSQTNITNTSNSTRAIVASVVAVVAVACFAIAFYLLRKKQATSEKRATVPELTNLPTPIRPPAMNPERHPSAPTEI